MISVIMFINELCSYFIFTQKVDIVLSYCLYIVVKVYLIGVSDHLVPSPGHLKVPGPHFENPCCN